MLAALALHMLGACRRPQELPQRPILLSEPGAVGPGAVAAATHGIDHQQCRERTCCLGLLQLTCADTSGPDAVRELANRAMFSILKFNSAHSARAHAAQLALSAAHLGCDPEHARGPFPQPADASAAGASHSAAHAVDPIGEIAGGDGAPSGTDQAVCVVRGTLTVDPEHQHFSLILGISGIPGHGELTALLALSTRSIPLLPHAAMCTAKAVAAESGARFFRR